MTRRTRNPSILLLVVALAATAWALQQYGSSLWAAGQPNSAASADTGGEHVVPAASIDQQKLQSLATAACTCTRSGGGKEECWKPYQYATAGFQVVGSATACAPVSTEVDCIATDQGETCVVTGYYVNGADDKDRDVVVCTAAEAQAIERAESEAFRVGGKPVDSSDATAWALANERAGDNISRVLDRIRRGENFTSNPKPGGCT